MRGTGAPGRGGRALLALALALLAGLLAPSLLTASADRPPDPGEAGERGGATSDPIGDVVRGAEGLAGETVDAAARIVGTALEPPGLGPDRGPTADDRDGREGKPSGRNGERRASRERASGPRGRSAASGAVEIRNFAYSPREITVRVGEAVRWTQFDDAPHDAKAFDDSFQTRLLTERGESDSVTFRQPGSFRYFCSVHPPSEPQWSDFTGTVTVLAASDGDGDRGRGGSGQPGGGTGTSDDSAGGGTGADGSGTGVGTGEGAGAGTQGAGARADTSGGLPATGLTLLPLIALGLALLSAGTALQRFRSRR